MSQSSFRSFQAAAQAAFESHAALLKATAPGVVPATGFQAALQFVRSQFEEGQVYYGKAKALVEMLVGDLSPRKYENLDELLSDNGYTPEQVKSLSGDARFDAIRRILDSRPREIDGFIAALDLIFEGRYGWPEGTARRMTCRNCFIALEHAMEYTPKGKRSVWVI
jgi:hypothetical protein